MRLRRVLVAFVFGAALAIPAPARADWLFTPFIGANLQAGGDALGFDAKSGTVNFGGSLGYMGAGIFGFEVDFGYAPNFFENDEVSTIFVAQDNRFVMNQIFILPGKRNSNLAKLILQCVLINDFVMPLS